MPAFPSTGLGDFMGLELTEDVIRANMPEYLPGATYNANQVRLEAMRTWLAEICTLLRPLSLVIKDLVT